MLCLELEGLEESEVALSRSTGCAHVARELLGARTRRLRCTSVLCSGLEWSLCAAHTWRAGLLLGCARIPWLWCAAVAGRFPWWECPCGERRLGGGGPAGSTEPAPQHLCLALAKVPRAQLGVPGEAPSVCRPVSWGAGRALGSAGPGLESASRAAQASWAGALAGRFLPPFCGREMPFCSVLQLLRPCTRKYSDIKIFICSSCIGYVDI